jgi:hypothetical protein
MSKTFHVLISGKIRFPDQFQDILAMIQGWQAQGHVGRIVYSGWEPDLIDHRDMIVGLAAQGIEVVLTYEPAVTIFGNAFHQMKNLHYGLAEFADDDVVLRARTERVNWGFAPDALASRFFDAPPVGENSPFDARVVVQYATPFQPYFCGDQSFIGRAADLRKLIAFDTWFAAEGAFLNPEQLLHSRPFLEKRPMLRDFFRVNPGLISQGLDISERVYRLMLSNSFYAGMLYWWLRDLQDSYVLGFEPSEFDEAAWPDGHAVEDLLRGDAVSLFPKVNLFHLAGIFDTNCPQIIEKMLQMPVQAGSPARLEDMAMQGAWADGGKKAGFPLPHRDAQQLGQSIVRLGVHCRTPHPSLLAGKLTIHYGLEHMFKV